MKTGYVVIGSGYGDEGKGLMTDYLAHQHGAILNVRFNGGAQAGHTVVTDQKRHIFHHFGSALFAGSTTFLSKYFIFNPILFNAEHEQLSGESALNSTLVDPLCYVTTPFEMLLNQAVERKRSGNRHGSCGVGISETVERETRGLVGKQTAGEFHLRVSDLHDLDYLDRRMALLYHCWFKPRCQELNLTVEVDLPFFIKKFRDEVEACLHKFTLVSTPTLGSLGSMPVIFEGAQGLRLDQNSREFPHVTRSNTGITNVIPLSGAFDLDELRVVYVTRAYQTRHGQGPLNHECDVSEIGDKIVEKTNVTNEFQGSFRYAPLDLDRLIQDVQADFNQLKQLPIYSSMELAITCFDHVSNQDKIPVIYGGQMDRVAPASLIFMLKDHLHPKTIYLSTGPSRKNVTAAYYQ